MIKQDAKKAKELQNSIWAIQKQMRRQQFQFEEKKAKLKDLDEYVHRAKEEYEKSLGAFAANSATDHEFRMMCSAVKVLETDAFQCVRKLNLQKNKNEKIRSDIDRYRKMILRLKEMFKNIDRSIRQDAMKRQQKEAEGDALFCKEKWFDDRVKSLIKKRTIERMNFLKLLEEQQELTDSFINLKKPLSDKQAFPVVSTDSNTNKDKKEYVCIKNNSEEMIKKVFKTALSNLSLRKRIHSCKAAVLKLQETTHSIESCAGVQGLDEVVKIFNQMEHRKFSLLMYIHSINSEIYSAKLLNTELTKMQAAKKNDFQKRLSKEQDEIKALKDKIQLEHDTTSKTEEKLVIANKTIEGIKEYAFQTLAQLLLEEGNDERAGKIQKLQSTMADTKQFLIQLEALLWDLRLFSKQNNVETARGGFLQSTENVPMDELGFEEFPETNASHLEQLSAASDLSLSNSDRSIFSLLNTFEYKPTDNSVSAPNETDFSKEGTDFTLSEANFVT